MKHLVFLLTLSVIFWNSQIFSKTWVDMPVVPDMTNMSEYDKASLWLEDRGEVNLVIYPNSPLDLKPLVNVISIVHVEAGKVTANADKAGFEKFLEYGFDYEAVTPEWLIGPVQMSDFADYLAGKAPADWYTYPTYGAYVGFLEKWEQDFPEICKMYDLGPAGKSSLNHRIYAMRISDNVAVNEAEPRYLETNTIHGDEVLNMMNCLHMVDTLLDNYGKDSRITALVDSLEMWFIPNMNPDGTYPQTDNTVDYAQRRNVANNWDLNRNNPCPCEQGNHKLYGLYSYYAKETEALMKLHGWYKFQFAQDQHGGTETYLWPYGGIITRPKDEDWYKWLCKRLVAQIHDDCNNNGYMTSCGGDGVGHIYTELYECHGIRCDMNDWVGNGKSVTLESSIQKKLPPSKLKEHWMWCKEALFMSYEILYKYGLHGIVTDSITGEPIFGVEISRNGDISNGTVLTDSCGRYVKYMNKGTYTLTFEKDGYQTKTISNFNIAAYDERYDLNVRLWNGINIGKDPISLINRIKIMPFRRGIKIFNIGKNIVMGIYNLNGCLIQRLSLPNASNVVWDGSDKNGRSLRNGCYILKVKSNNKEISKSFILNR